MVENYSLKNREYSPSGDSAFESDAFKGRDGDRAKFAEVLTRFLENTQSDFVLNIDSEWGSGKTYFLREWQKQLLSENKLCIYFNAWKHDHEENAFPPIFATIADNLPRNDQKQKDIYNSILDTGGKLILGLGKKFIGDETVDAITDVFGQKVIDSFQNKQSELENYKTSLQKSTDLSSNGKVFIFIDELDRCRPSFSVEVLEKIKHFFEIDNIIFVIATDNDQLSATVKKFYGDEFSASKYLERFFDQQTILPKPDTCGFIELIFEKYPMPYANRISQSDNSPELSKRLMSSLFNDFNIELRTINRMYSKIFLIMNSSDKNLNLFLVQLFVIMEDIKLDFFYFLKSESSRNETLHLAYKRMTGNDVNVLKSDRFYNDVLNLKITTFNIGISQCYELVLGMKNNNHDSRLVRELKTDHNDRTTRSDYLKDHFDAMNLFNNDILES
ncbi:P-loop NTPase fold protein [Lentisphaera profundi]|uniref:P-loop NTPase fold protein n=1 Tax=Lentisphaera profundi TaxID=1658616 RepID=A0ABY7VRX7_9BACT|nr:P-loop NTPase fold protein [Lentisphaera profundi]WDE96960.1 P-loop NTPase fold protein [Lentisphaera profundi]